jgi:heme O synthase-like polyprenyltransferase
MAISFKCSKDYDFAGYKMLSIQDHEMCANQAIIHSFLYFPLFLSLPYYNASIPYWFVASSCAITYHYLFKPSIEFRRNIKSNDSIIYASNSTFKFISLRYIVLEQFETFGNFICHSR